jgi:hypothetical protein
MKAMKDKGINPLERSAQTGLFGSLQLEDLNAK